MLPRVLTLALWLFAAAASASPLPEYPFVFTTGSAKVESPPDTVRLSFTVADHNRDPRLAAAAVESTLKSIMTVLAAAAINERDIDASVVDKSPRSHWDQARSQSIPDGYEVSRKVTVVGRDLGKYPQMVRALLQLLGTVGFRAEFDRSDRSKMEADLLISAAKDAKARAERMATQFGRKLGPVHAIAQTAFSALPDEFGFSYRASASPALAMEVAVTGEKYSMERLLAPATITISEDVNVVYELQAPQ
jgi:uncharacterized protein YggE